MCVRVQKKWFHREFKPNAYMWIYIVDGPLLCFVFAFFLHILSHSFLSLFLSSIESSIINIHKIGCVSEHALAKSFIRKNSKLYKIKIYLYFLLPFLLLFQTRPQFLAFFFLYLSSLFYLSLSPGCWPCVSMCIRIYRLGISRNNSICR